MACSMHSKHKPGMLCYKSSSKSLDILSLHKHHRRSCELKRFKNVCPTCAVSRTDSILEELNESIAGNFCCVGYEDNYLYGVKMYCNWDSLQSASARGK
jgi:hypothetical protein